jgi:hypothetical protein
VGRWPCFIGIGFWVGRDAASFLLGVPSLPMSSIDIKKVRRHSPGVPGIRSRRNPDEHYIVAVQDLDREKVGDSTMLLRTKVQGVGRGIGDAERHPDVGRAPAQSLGMIVLCP